MSIDSGELQQIKNIAYIATIFNLLKLKIILTLIISYSEIYKSFFRNIFDDIYQIRIK